MLHLKNCQMPTSIFVWCFSPRIHKGPQDGKARWCDSYSGYYFTNITMEMFLIWKWSMSLHANYFGMSLHKSWCWELAIHLFAAIRQLKVMVIMRCAIRPSDHNIPHYLHVMSTDSDTSTENKTNKCERSLIPIWNTMISSRPSKLNWSVGHM